MGNSFAGGGAYYYYEDFTGVTNDPYFDYTYNNPGGSETRPVNVNVMYIIKH